MTAASIVQALRDAGIRVEFGGSRFRTIGRVPSYLKGPIKENRDQILEFLKAETEEQGAVRWRTIRSGLLGGEAFLLVMSEKYLEEAKKENSGMVVYLQREALDLIDRGASDDAIRTLHMIKQKLGGHVLPQAPE